MSRKNVVGDEGELAGWFDPADSEAFEEDTRWDGHNHVSLATGSQYDHEVLYHTPGCRWVLHWFSQWEGSQESYRWLTGEQALNWLLTNNQDEAAEKYFEPIPPEKGPEVVPQEGVGYRPQTVGGDEVAQRRAVLAKVRAGAEALKEAYPTLRDDFTDQWFMKTSRIVLDAAGMNGILEECDEPH